MRNLLIAAGMMMAGIAAGKEEVQFGPYDKLPCELYAMEAGRAMWFRQYGELPPPLHSNHEVPRALEIFLEGVKREPVHETEEQKQLSINTFSGKIKAFCLRDLEKRLRAEQGLSEE